MRNKIMNKVILTFSLALIFIALSTTLLAQALPMEDFEGTFPPNGWSIVSTGDTTASWQQYEDGYESSFCASISSCPEGQHSDWWLITPAIVLSGANELIFAEKNIGLPASVSHHEIWISTSSSVPNLVNNPFTLLTELVEPARRFTLRNVDLSDYAGQTVYIAFRYSGTNETDWSVDQVQVQASVETFISDFPYQESFENTFPPDGWDFIVIDAGTGRYPTWNQTSQGNSPLCSPNDGSNCIEINSSQTSAGTTSRLILPGIIVPSGYQPVVSFKMVLSNGGEGILEEGIQVESSFDKETWSNVGPFHSRYGSYMLPYWSTVTDTIAAQGPDTLFIALKTVSQGISNIHIDLLQVSLLEAVSYPIISDLSVQASGNNSVLLSWSAPENPPAPITGYKLYRNHEFLAEVTGNQFMDSISPNTTYQYTATVLYSEIESATSNVVEISITPIADQTIQPLKSDLSAFPNPFNPSTTIKYNVRSNGNATVVVYNCLGQRVRTLENGYHKPQTYNVRWDGKDSDLRPVSSGIYFIRFTSNGQTATSKVILVK